MKTVKFWSQSGYGETIVTHLEDVIAVQRWGEVIGPASYIVYKDGARVLVCGTAEEVMAVIAAACVEVG